MREIKFRYVCKRDNGHTFSQIFTIGEIEQGDAYRWLQQNFVGMFHLERNEYTGLKDRKGREIYEGDIVRDVHGLSRIEYAVSNHTGSKFCNTYEGNPATNPNANGSWEMCYYSSTDDMEVIGNIYENPELLEAGIGRQ